MAGAEQKITFAMIYISYLLNIYMRRSVTMAMVDIAKTENLEENHMGLILSSQMFSYTASKFIAGILVDFVSPRIVLSTGLICTGLTVTVFAGFSGSPFVFAGLWFLNGLACGPGWPAAALIMKKWFRKDQFGTAWSTLSTSMNVAGTMGPLITAYVVMVAGWRVSLLVPGMVGVGFGVLCFLCVKDSPDETVEENSSTSTTKNGKYMDLHDSAGEASMSRLQLLRVPGFLGICVTYGVVCFIQYGSLQWGPVYLVKDAGHSILTGNSYVSSLEIGGIIGSLVAGYTSDYLLRKHPSIANHIVRQSVIGWFSIALAGFLYLMTYCITADTSTMFIWLVGFGCGFTIYGPISIFGVAAMECVPCHVAGTGHAVACLMSNVGQMLAGLPLSYIAQQSGWQSVFLVQLLLSIQMALYLLFYTLYAKHKSGEHKKQE